MHRGLARLMLLAVVVRMTLREPPRGLAELEAAPAPAETVAAETNDDWRAVMRFMLSLRAFRHLSMAGALHAFVGYGAGLWNPSFFLRAHEMGLGETGKWFFFITIGASVKFIERSLAQGVRASESRDARRLGVARGRGKADRRLGRGPRIRMEGVP